MDNAQNGIAVRNGLHEYAHRQKVEYVGKILVTVFHLAVNAVKMLSTPFDFALQMSFFKFLPDFGYGVVNESLPFSPFLLHLVD